MERVMQRDKTGCGLACVAMLAGRRCEIVRHKAVDVLPPLFNDDFGRRRGRGYSLWTCTWHLRELLEVYDLRLSRFVTCNERMRDQPMRFDECAEYMTTRTRANGRNAIVATHRRNQAGILDGQPVDNDNDRYHWVVWDGEHYCIHDPRYPPYPNIRPWFYMFLKGAYILDDPKVGQNFEIWQLLALFLQNDVWRLIVCAKPPGRCVTG